MAGLPWIRMTYFSRASLGGCRDRGGGGVGADTWLEGAGLGLLAWVGFPLVILTGSVLHERYPWPLAAIHLGDWLLKLLLVAAVVSAWR